MMQVLVFGKTGQVATALGKMDGVTLLAREVADLTNPDQCAAMIENSGADAVINAAAYTAVDKAETEQNLATTINGDAPSAMARAASDKGVPFIQISTDYVFDGSGDAPWKPQDTPNPLGVYGCSKLAGEQGVIGAGGSVLRTSWVFSATGQNFVKTMLRLGETRDELNIVADQIGGPTSAQSIAQACYAIAANLCQNPQNRGIYHFSGQEDVSWADFARAVFKQAGMDVTVNEIPTSDYPTPAQRPLNSRLDCSITVDTFALARPDWRADLAQVLAELKRA